MNDLLLGKTILITGGTSRLGTAFVRKAIREQARVFFTYHHAEEEARVLSGEGAEGFQLPLESIPAIDQFIQCLKTKTDNLDILIHNAAATRDHTILNMTEIVL